MDAALEDALIEAVYRAGVEPGAWNEVMQLLGQAFPSSAQTFYFLDRPTGRVRPMALNGIAPRWLAAFDALYFAPDNPWIRHSARLHRPGVVRTNERLAAILGDAQALYRSAYYNDWMRPQGFRFSIGNTLMVDDGVVANVTLLRAPDRPTFTVAEVEAFERLSHHMTRSMRMAVRLEHAETAALGAVALDALRHGVALVDAGLRLAYANAAMEALLQAGHGLRLRGGTLVAPLAAAQRRLEVLVATVLSPARAAPADLLPVVLPGQGKGRQIVQAVPAGGRVGRYLPSRPLALLTVSESRQWPRVSTEAVRQLYDCTAAEARLVVALAGGASLRQAAQTAGITYETARTRLKAVFEKAGVHRQAQLVARVVADLRP